MMNYSQQRSLLERLEKVFNDTAKDRPRRPIDPKSLEATGWVLHEMLVMHRATNDERAKLGRGPVSLEAVEKKEQLARGHCDYGSKWALGCRDLVLMEDYPNE